MFRLLIISLCFCGTFLCAIVAYVGTESAKSTEVQQKLPAETVACRQLLDQRPEKPTNLKLSEFRAGKYFGSRDWDGDKNWEYLAVPFFPHEINKLKHNYKAVIVCFDDVKTRERLTELVLESEIEAHYSPSRQTLPNDIHSQLAQKYASMDFRNCVVLETGKLVPQPVQLGPITQIASLSFGALTLFVGLWNLVVFLFRGFSRRTRESNAVETTINRAGLPSDPERPANSGADQGTSLLEHLEKIKV